MNRSHKGKGTPQRLKPCMPPLLEEETIPLLKAAGGTSYGGTACENLVKAYFLSKCINVSEPDVDNGVDLLIEKPQGWVRGQVKKIVYQSKLDYKRKKRSGEEIYHSRFNFNFQSCGRLCSHLKNGRKQRGPEILDYFYHVLLTPYRQLIWETPVNLIPLRNDGTFIHGKNPSLDKDSWIRKKAEIDFNQLLIYSQFHPIIFKTFPNFFLKEKTNTLDKLFNNDK